MRILQVPHKACDYTCMWNGFEDLYAWKTGNRAPDYLFFGMSGFCNFVYLKHKSAACKRTIYWSNGVTRKMYAFMEEIIGFHYSVTEGRSFSYSLKLAKQRIDQGTPVILGALDMYYLPYYPKYFHTVHIPIHHILMVGYDDQERNIFVYDCGKDDVESLSYEDLQDAWNVNLPGFSKKNTMFTITFDPTIHTIEDIACHGLYKKCLLNLEPPVRIFGIPAMKKFGKEFVAWEHELSPEDYQRALFHLVEYTGFPPMLPSALIRGEQDETPQNHRGSREKFAELLLSCSQLFHVPEIGSSAELFLRSGDVIDVLTRELTAYILEPERGIHRIADMIREIAEIEEQAYRQLLACLNNSQR